MITIEVCERTGDRGFGNSPSYHAQIKNQPTHWGSGSSEVWAIGDLVKTHSFSFGLSIKQIQTFCKLPACEVGDAIKKGFNSEIEIINLGRQAR